MVGWISRSSRTEASTRVGLVQKVFKVLFPLICDKHLVLDKRWTITRLLGRLNIIFTGIWLYWCWDPTLSNFAEWTVVTAPLPWRFTITARVQLRGVFTTALLSWGLLLWKPQRKTNQTNLSEARRAVALDHRGSLKLMTWCEVLSRNCYLATAPYTLCVASSPDAHNQRSIFPVVLLL